MEDTTTVADIMTREVVAVASDSNVADLLDRMRTGGIRHVAVTRDNRFSGLVSDRIAIDLLGTSPSTLRVRQVRDLVLDRRASVARDVRVADAARIALRHPSGALAVVGDDGEIEGIVTGADLLRALVS